MTRSTSLTFSWCWLVAGTITCVDAGTRVTRPDHPRELSVEFEALASNPMNPSSSSVAEPSGSGVVYLSMRPLTIVGGRTLTVKHSTTGYERSEPLVDGGRDPMVVVASVNDTLQLVATDSMGGTMATTLIVSARRPPRVVRTSPTQRKADVPLNARITIVFSEPIAPAALTAGAVRLQQGDAIVTGALQLSPDQLAVVFTPATDLAASTEYRIFITQSVIDLQGDALDSAMTVEFRTTNPIDPPVLGASLDISTVTTGVDLDADGYRVGVDGYSVVPPKPIGLNARTPMTVPAGQHWIWLADVDPNCSVAEELVPVSIQPGQATSIVFRISCAPRSEQAGDSLAGVFDMLRWEFFRDSAYTDRYVDPVAWAGTLMFRGIGGGSYRWQWLGRTPGIVREPMGGTATLAGPSLRASRTRQLVYTECDVGDCGGPLHGANGHVPSPDMGEYTMVRNGDGMIITGPTDCFFSKREDGWYACQPAWTRLTLQKVR